MDVEFGPNISTSFCRSMQVRELSDSRRCHLPMYANSFETHKESYLSNSSHDPGACANGRCLLVAHLYEGVPVEECSLNHFLYTLLGATSMRLRYHQCFRSLDMARAHSPRFEDQEHTVRFQATDRRHHFYLPEKKPLHPQALEPSSEALHSGVEALGSAFLWHLEYRIRTESYAWCRGYTPGAVHHTAIRIRCCRCRARSAVGTGAWSDASTEAYRGFFGAT